MIKSCIFCGQKPNKKSKEHVIPQWLIELTGDPKRNTIIGKRNGDTIRFPWKNFTFGACTSCNTEFSDLEANSRTIVLKIINKEKINKIEIHTLLNWFDKVRIGLWLGYLQLYQKAEFIPNFHIKSRMGVSDRGMSISYIQDNWEGISFLGTETPIFNIAPSCFTLIINNVVFFNFSKEFLFCRRLGLPFPVKTYMIPNTFQLTTDELLEGTGRVMLPVIRTNFPNKSIYIYEPILFSFNEEYEKIEEYGGIDDIFIQNDFTKENYFLENDYLDLESSISIDNRRSFYDKIGVQTLDFQIFILENNCPSLERLSKEERKGLMKYYKQCIQTNSKIIQRIKRR